MTLHHFPWQGHLRLPSLVLPPAKLALITVGDGVGRDSRLMKVTFDLYNALLPPPSHEQKKKKSTRVWKLHTVRERNRRDEGEESSDCTIQHAGERFPRFSHQSSRPSADQLSQSAETVWSWQTNWENFLPRRQQEMTARTFPHYTQNTFFILSFFVELWNVSFLLGIILIII